MSSGIMRPAGLEAIERETRALGFSMASELETGVLLRTLAALKPAGAFLELGTGTGIGTAWILGGMDSASRLATVDSEAKYVAVARRHLGRDPRVRFHVEQGEAFLHRLRGSEFDLIFADTWPGKFNHLEDALELLRTGGFYVVDDLLPQVNWPEGHAPKVAALISALERNANLVLGRLMWSSGIIVATRRLKGAAKLISDSSAPVVAITSVPRRAR